MGKIGTHYLDGLSYDSHSSDCGMVGQLDKPGCCILFLKKFTLVGRWAGLKDTHYLDGLEYDSQSWVAGWLGGWMAGWLGGWVAGWLGGWMTG